MREVERLRRALEATYHGDPWYGPPVAQILEGVDAAQAAGHPVPGAHSMWELVVHMTAWVNETNRRLRGGAHADPAEGDWPLITSTTPASWATAKAALAQAHGTLAGTLTAMDDSELARPVGTQLDGAGQAVTRYQTIVGLLQHDAYHGAQILLLKKIFKPT